MVLEPGTDIGAVEGDCAWADGDEMLAIEWLSWGEVALRRCVACVAPWSREGDKAMTSLEGLR